MSDADRIAQLEAENKLMRRALRRCKPLVAEEINAWLESNCVIRNGKPDRSTIDVSADAQVKRLEALMRDIRAALSTTASKGGADELCEGCPPVGYPTEKTRCLPCPRRASKGGGDE